MAQIQESLEPMVSETESLIQEYREKINKALEIESNNLKEKAERDASQIIYKAKEEAEKAIVQATYEAKVESERIISRAKDEAQQIIGKSREEAAEAHRESVRVIHKAREKASQVVTEVIESGTKKAQIEFAQTASEAKSKISMIMVQVNKSVEQIIGETEANVKAELESLAALIPETEIEQEPLCEEINDVAEVNCQQENGEADITTASVSEEIEPDFPAIVDKRDALIEESNDIRLFKGCLKLELVPPFNQERLEGVPNWLSRITGLKVISTGSHASSNRWVTTHSIDLEQPIPLLNVLKAVPAIKDVAERKGKIVITLK